MRRRGGSGQLLVLGGTWFALGREEVNVSVERGIDRLIQVLQFGPDPDQRLWACVGEMEFHTRADQFAVDT